MRIKHFLFFFIVTVLLVLCISCNPDQTEQKGTPENPSDEIGYPVSVSENNNLEEGYPLPEYQPEAAPGITPNPSLGVVHGKIFHNGEPVVGYSVFLADILVDSQGVERTASLKQSSAPQAVLDYNGVFVFNDVPPDRYALMFSDGMSSYLLLKPDQEVEEAIIINVDAGKQFDLGVLDFSDFPIE